MLKKAFTTKKEISDFKKQYLSGNIETEVISNVLQPFYENKFSVLKNYNEFWYNKEEKNAGLKQILLLMINSHSKEALTEEFGKYDFSFNGNRRYENYVLNFEDSLFIVPSKREIVLESGITKELVDKMIRFENAFCQMVINNIIKNKDTLETYKKESIEKLKKYNIIDENGQIQFEAAPAKNIKLKM
ncbi:TPA: hypothetical protein NV714_005291 [Escherichia coli]|nr:hypothetical protein [Escherichia coli]